MSIITKVQSLNYKKIISFLLITILFIFVLLSLYSYSSYDISLNTASFEITNFMGYYGSIFADILIQSIGYTSCLLPLFLFAWMVNIIFVKNMDNIDLKIISYIFSILLFSIAFATIIHDMNVLINGYGGIIGSYLWNIILNNEFVYQNSKYVLYTIYAVAIVLFSYSINIPQKIWFNIISYVASVILNIIYTVIRSILVNIKSRFTNGLINIIDRAKAGLVNSKSRTVKADEIINQDGKQENYYTSQNDVELSKPITNFEPTPFKEKSLSKQNINEKLSMFTNMISKNSNKEQAVQENPEVQDNIETSNYENNSYELPNQKIDDNHVFENDKLENIDYDANNYDEFQQSGKEDQFQHNQDINENNDIHNIEQGYKKPHINLLENYGQELSYELNEDEKLANINILESILLDYGVKGEIMDVKFGPVVTTYEFEPDKGVRTSRVINLADDIARSLSAISVRIYPIPGTSYIGIETPNIERHTIAYKELVNTEEFKNTEHQLPIILGKDVKGTPIISNLATMPHLLIAGTTGSGKSVGINGIILSLLYKFGPDELKLIMIDPKMLEFSVYEEIPHLISPVVTDPKKAITALKWAVNEMETRYKTMSKVGVRNIVNFNNKIRENIKSNKIMTHEVIKGYDNMGEPITSQEIIEYHELPYIVIIIDEVADLMLVAGKEVDGLIQRLAQMARAAGIHIIMATQRPSVDVITGTIKANFPARLSYKLTTSIDSRTILGVNGAENLLGKGDLLASENGYKPTRIHAAFVQDEEVQRVCDYIRQYAEPTYINDIVAEQAEQAELSDVDSMYEEALNLIIREGKASTSFIQRSLRIGYNRAATIMDQLEKNKVVSPANSVGKRDILVQNYD